MLKIIIVYWFVRFKRRHIETAWEYMTPKIINYAPKRTWKQIFSILSMPKEEFK